jgi:peptide/nickel transport system permease protein
MNTQQRSTVRSVGAWFMTTLALSQTGKAAITLSWRESIWGRLTTSLLRNKLALSGLIIVVFLIVLAIFAPVLAPYDPLALDMNARFAPPTLAHPFGTDELGRDILSRIIFASRISVLSSIAAVTVAMLIGVPWGLVAGFYRGYVESLLMMVIDFLLAVPSILMALVIIAILGPSSFNAMVAIAVASVSAFARLTRASTLAECERDYVLASRSIGANDLHILLKDVLPNCLTPIIVQLTVALGFAILLESALSFLGMGTQPPDPSWGFMLSMGRRYLSQSPWYGIFPGAIIAILVLALGFLADGLQRALSGNSER